jgi:hypothetical protein
MFSLLLSLLVSSFQDSNSSLVIQELPGIESTKSRSSLSYSENRLTEPKLSPKQHWPFDWLVYGSGKKDDDSGWERRLRVYAQSRNPDHDLLIPIARMAMRLWEYNVESLKLDHAYAYNNRTVDIYLCDGGPASGEQLFGEETINNASVKVNTIYIYDIRSLTNPLEVAREVAHEYGHATLPPIGGFSEPEGWVSGSLGEHLYLLWMRDRMKSKQLMEGDAAGVSFQKLDAWVGSHVDPLVLTAATSGPRIALLKKNTAAAYDAYLGLALYARTILPDEAFSRSLKLTGSTLAKDYPAAIISAVEEAAPLTLKIPSSLIGRSIWIPVGTCRLQNAASLVQSQGWVKVKAKSANLKIRLSSDSRHE